jgi:transcriptional regulator with XRE-family HTH domain
MTEPDAFPEEISTLRAMSGLSIAALAARVGLPAEHLADMEAGTRPISSNIYDRIFKVVEDVIFEMEDPGPLWWG